MKVEIPFSQVWHNSSLLNFFFRHQSKKTLEEFMDRVTVTTDEALDAIENYADLYCLELDDIEEMFYEDSIKDIAEQLNIELIDDDDDDDDDE